MAGNKKKKIDPLFQLFEHYLLNRSYEDSGAFTKEVSEEYLSYLDSTPAHVPFHVRKNILEDLEAETHELLVKKMYGCVKAADHTNYGQVLEEKGGQLTALEFDPPQQTPTANEESVGKAEELFKEDDPSAFQKTGSRVR